MSLDDGPDGAIYTCQRDGIVYSFELRAPGTRVVGQCEENLAEGEWKTYKHGQLYRIESYRRGIQVGVSTL